MICCCVSPMMKDPINLQHFTSISFTQQRKYEVTTVCSSADCLGPCDLLLVWGEHVSRRPSLHPTPSEGGSLTQAANTLTSLSYGIVWFYRSQDHSSASYWATHTHCAKNKGFILQKFALLTVPNMTLTDCIQTASRLHPDRIKDHWIHQS